MQQRSSLMIEEFILQRTAQIEERLSQLVPDEDTSYSKLFRAARYALLGGGKRIRPLLCLAAAEALGGDAEVALNPACALELIHTYSLIHDDLPCMDNDDFRRGKPTVHKQFNEGLATLAGDFLLTHAFQILAHSKGLSAEQRIQLIATCSEKAGGSGMIAGQTLDIEAENKTIGIESLKDIHRRKTGALITASIEMGAISAGADSFTLKELSCFGDEIGLAFQIVDDVIDVTSSEKKHGKMQSSDQINGKTTYVSLFGVDRSKKMASDLLASSVEKLKCLRLENSSLKGLAELIVNRKL